MRRDRKSRFEHPKHDTPIVDNSGDDWIKGVRESLLKRELHIIVTHPDEDHQSGLRALLDATDAHILLFSGHGFSRQEFHDPSHNAVLSAKLVKPYRNADDGVYVEALRTHWLRMLDLIRKDPDSIYQISPRKIEELIACTYEQDGFSVILTPRSGDNGRDVIAMREGFYSLRIFDQVKALKRDHSVTADDVRALLGTLWADNVSKAVMTTTSSFAPRIMNDPVIRLNVPYRLQLRDRGALVDWFESVRRRKRGGSPTR
jgi:restriction system protein